LTSSSGFFIKALNEDWKEGAERTVVLPEACPRARKIYTQWLYTGRVFCSPVDKGPFQNELKKLIACYTLGDYLRDTDFLDAVVDGIGESCVEHQKIAVGFVIEVYPITTKDSLYRKLCRDLVMCTIHRGHSGHLRAHDLPKEFLKDVLIDMAPQLTKAYRSREFDAFFKSKGDCEYHEHVPLNKP
jgi:hypothetical protein